MSRWRIALLVAFAISLAALAVKLDVADVVPRLRARSDALGAWGPVVLVAVYVPATMLGVPGTPFTVAAPLLFSGPVAFVTMVVASTLSASGGFLISRHLARDVLTRRLRTHPRFNQLDRLLDAHAWIAIPFIRVVPFPFVVSNYGLGLTRIGFWRYLAWSEVGMIPVNALFVLGLDAILRAVSGNMSWAMTASAMVAAGIIVVLVLLGRRRWREAEAVPIA
ncbi:MAG TPA: VTT domain-containing protein [Candidatus Nitrosocosmicus sp.]|nr:VTT domain-containing protein [Candidatus Nitrosocosmicus sp.]